MQLLVKLPSRQRPATLLKVARMYRDMARDATVLVTLDNDDRTAPIKQLNDMGVLVNTMDRVSKIAAVNHGLSDLHWDVVLVASDDMWPIMEGYDDIIRRDMPDDLDACLWYHDGVQSRLCTLPVMGRKYFDRTGRVYHPGYMSYYADDHMHIEARNLGKLSPMLPCIIKHEHPFFKGAMPNDSLYNFNRTHKAQDKAFYLSQGLGSL